MKEDVDMEDGYYTNTRSEVYELVPKNVRRILEIGCAAGGFRQNFPSYVEYWGVEPFAPAAEVACTKGMKILCGTYDTVEDQIPNGYFDVVVCNDVIEHVISPYELLRSLQGKLAPKGVVVGSIPNVRYIGNLLKLIFKRDWEYTDSGILDKTHLRFFTSRSFRRLMESVDFHLDIVTSVQSMKMKIFKIIFLPVLIIVGFDVCYFQILFRAVKAHEEI